jgi:septal ring factor EnvC (AmiA/AmiB activator)
MGSSSDEDSPIGETGPAGQRGLAKHEVSSGQRPALYIEFRKDGDPIDPRPWLMMSDKKARG